MVIHYTIRNAVKVRGFRTEGNSGDHLDLTDALQDKTAAISFFYTDENIMCMTTHCAA